MSSRLQVHLDQAHEPDRALAEEAAQATFAALNAGAGVPVPQAPVLSMQLRPLSQRNAQLPLAEHAAEASLEAPRWLSQQLTSKTTNEESGE